MVAITKVGKKGEVVLRKSEREKAGIKPRDKVLIIGTSRGIIIKKIPSLKELLSRPSVIELSLQELKRLREEVRKELYGRLTR